MTTLHGLVPIRRSTVRGHFIERGEELRRRISLDRSFINFTVTYRSLKEPKSLVGLLKCELKFH